MNDKGRRGGRGRGHRENNGPGRPHNRLTWQRPRRDVREENKYNPPYQRPSQYHGSPRQRLGPRWDRTEHLRVPNMDMNVEWRENYNVHDSPRPEFISPQYYSKAEDHLRVPISPIPLLDVKIDAPAQAPPPATAKALKEDKDSSMHSLLDSLGKIMKEKKLEDRLDELERRLTAENESFNARLTRLETLFFEEKDGNINNELTMSNMMDRVEIIEQNLFMKPPSSRPSLQNSSITSSGSNEQSAESPPLIILDTPISIKEEKKDDGPRTDSKPAVHFIFDDEQFVEVDIDGVGNKSINNEWSGVRVWFGVDHPMNISRPLLEKDVSSKKAILFALYLAISAAKCAGLVKLKIQTTNAFCIKCLTKIPEWKSQDWRRKSGVRITNLTEVLQISDAIECMEIKVTELGSTAENRARRMVKVEAEALC